MNALYEAVRSELDGVKQDQNELQELREMKDDVARKEKQQAAIVENQVGGWVRVCWLCVGCVWL